MFLKLFSIVRITNKLMTSWPYSPTCMDSFPLQWTVDGPLTEPARQLVTLEFRPKLAPTLRLRMAARIVSAMRRPKFATWPLVLGVSIICSLLTMLQCIRLQVWLEESRWKGMVGFASFTRYPLSPIPGFKPTDVKAAVETYCPKDATLCL